MRANRVAEVIEPSKKEKGKEKKDTEKRLQIIEIKGKETKLSIKKVFRLRTTLPHFLQ
jgi:hypothetical protein